MNIPELQTLAQEIPYTEGRWWVVTRPGSAEESRVMSTSGTIALCDGRVLLGEKERAAFIAACDPQTVLALTDAVEAAEPLVAQVRKSVAEWYTDSTPMADLRDALAAYDAALAAIKATA